VPGAVEAPGNAAPHATKHAMLARVHYLDTHRFSWILFLKPSLTGDEPADVQQYQKMQPDFPQESTMDQYFDEAQWESYRKLGEHIGHLVFTTPVTQPTSGRPGWSPSTMRPPASSQNGSSSSGSHRPRKQRPPRQVSPAPATAADSPASN
jgi:hypothetical protein